LKLIDDQPVVGTELVEGGKRLVGKHADTLGRHRAGLPHDAAHRTIWCDLSSAGVGGAIEIRPRYSVVAADGLGTRCTGHTSRDQETKNKAAHCGPRRFFRSGVDFVYFSHYRQTTFLQLSMASATERLTKKNGWDIACPVGAFASSS